MAKKINVKMAAKMELSETIFNALADAGVSVSKESDDYGFTSGTLVIHGDVTDVQVKLITPKAKVWRYEVLEDEVVENEDEVVES